MALLKDIHDGLSPPPHCDRFSVVSDYLYCHYIWDGQDDRGWGCGYRSLQTLCSWINGKTISKQNTRIPSIHVIQETLVAIGDKDTQFVGSRDWIGSVEVGLVIDKLYDIPCKILHIRSGSDIKTHMDALERHFMTHRSPIMMGGESDTSSKGIIGIARSPAQHHLLILVRGKISNQALLRPMCRDPHYYTQGSGEITRTQLQDEGWVQWRNIDTLHQDTFYNICLPQTKDLLPDV